MTSRERIMNTLLGQPADRTPFGVGLGFLPWSSTLKRWQEETGLADLSLAAYFDYDQGFSIAPLEYGPFPRFPIEIISEDADYVTRTDFRGLTLRNRKDNESMPDFLDYPVKTEADWEQYKAQRLQIHPIGERLASLETFLSDCRTNGAPVQVGVFPWGMFGSPRDLLGAEELLISFYTRPALLHDMMQTYTDLWLALYAEVAARIPIDHIHIWEDMSGCQGSLISMDMVEEFMMPCYDRISRFAAEHGIPLVSVDSDGKVEELVPVMMRHGINFFFPFEVQAGNDILEYRKNYPELAIMGGLDKNALAGNAPQQAMHRELDKAEAMLAHGRYIPGFDHLIPPNVPWKKWETFMHLLKKMIGA